MTQIYIEQLFCIYTHFNEAYPVEAYPVEAYPVTAAGKC